MEFPPSLPPSIDTEKLKEYIFTGIKFGAGIGAILIIPVIFSFFWLIFPESLGNFASILFVPTILIGAILGAVLGGLAGFAYWSFENKLNNPSSSSTISELSDTNSNIQTNRGCSHSTIQILGIFGTLATIIACCIAGLQLLIQVAKP